MTERTLRTDRLRLSPLDAAAVDALLAGDAERLRALTGSHFSRASAPPYMAEALPEVRERLRLYPEEAPWWNWLIAREDTGEAVGAVALGGPPDSAGAVLVGYAVYPEHEGHGFATEAVRAMIGWAFRQPGVREVRALAPVWNTPALRVAENVGMRPVASGEDDDVGEVLVYAVTAPASVGSGG
ncbi:MAG TPA: GNAT family N-acetyltransferase [Gemmatimonadales bacterium]|nr:GNAT family N-acetyltransferase [Gemmatimonadales bacterium]